MFDKFDLNPFEITSYWWINKIRDKVKELYMSDYFTRREELFLNIFKNFTDEDYRTMYLELKDLIFQDVIDYHSFNNVGLYNQDTIVHNHDRLNKELSTIINVDIPDINLHMRNMKNYKIYTGYDGAYQYNYLDKIEELDKTYDNDYIISGNKEILNLYKSIIVAIKELSINNEDIITELFIKLFSLEYLNYNNLDIDIEMMKEYCSYMINKINDLGMIKGRSYNEIIRVTEIINFYLNGIRGYKRIGKHYANYIQENKEKVLKK